MSPLCILNPLGQIVTKVRPDVPPGWTPPEGHTAVPENQLPPGTVWAPQPPVPVPQEVANYALQIALEEQGKLAEIEGVLNNLPTQGGVRAQAKSRWAKKPTIRRDTPLFTVVKQAVGWTDQFIDNLFIRAAQIESE